MMEEGKGILLSLLFPLREEDLSSGDREVFCRALCYEAEYLFSGKNEEGTVKSEKAGDYSVTYRSVSDKKTVSVFGSEVSPAACHLLLASGLMLRWV